MLSHYDPVRHAILDKFEQAPGVINEDALTWEPGRAFERILSISTFEHIGFDDDDKDPTGQRILDALRPDPWIPGSEGSPRDHRGFGIQSRV